MSGLIIVLLLGGVVAVLGARHMGVRWSSSGSGDTLVHLWRRAWPSARLTWGQIEKRILGRMLATVSSGVSGRVLVPARFTVRVSEADHATLGDAIPIVTADLAAEVRRRAEAEGWVLSGGPVVEVVCDPAVYDGDPTVAASFSLGDAAALATGAHDGMTRTMPASPRTPVPAPVTASEDLAGLVAPPTHGAPVATEGHTVPMSSARPTGSQPTVVSGGDASEGTAVLTFTDGRRAPLSPASEEVRIGRSPASDVVLGDPTVSGEHAAVVHDGMTWRVADLGSTNGTYVNGARIDVGAARAAALAPGDEIRFGRRGPACSFGRTADAPLLATG